MADVIVFCQAPADIKYVLALREKRKEDDFHIFAVNVQALYKFLSTCGAEYSSLEYLPLSKPYYFYKIWKNIKNAVFISRIKRTKLAGFKGAHVYFFSPCSDWVTGALVNYLSKNNEVIFLEHDSHRPVPIALSFADRLGVFLLRYTTGTRFLFGSFGEESLYYKHVLFWEEYRGKTNEQDARSFLQDELLQVTEKYKYILPHCDRSLLLFDAHLEHVAKNGDKLLKQLVELALSSGYKVFVKFHPRLGGKEFYKNYNVTILPDYVPGEFLPVEQFTLIFSFCSTALAEAAKKRKGDGVYSMFKLLDFSDKGFEKIHARLLQERSGGYIQFINTVQELNNALLEGKIAF
jgi:hypothetical protein